MQNLLYFPPEMMAARRWGLWEKVPRRKKDGTVEIGKKPWQNPNYYKATSAVDPQSWLLASEASAIYHSNPEQFGGPAFFTGGGWCLLDLDKIRWLIEAYKRNPQDGLVADVMRLLHHTYCEVSTSGKGLHFVFRVDGSVKNFGQRTVLPAKTDKDNQDEDNHNNFRKELYHGKRMVALTGNWINPGSGIATINQDEWRNLYEFIFNEPLKDQRTAAPITFRFDGPRPANNAVDKIICQVLNGPSGNHFRKCLDGGVFQNAIDHSDQDWACVKEIMEYTRDPQLIDAVFRRTSLMRPKWDEPRGNQTYGQETITNALDPQ